MKRDVLEQAGIDLAIAEQILLEAPWSFGRRRSPKETVDLCCLIGKPYYEKRAAQLDSIIAARERHDLERRREYNTAWKRNKRARATFKP